MSREDRDTAAAILASAREQFLTRGYEKATLRDICAGAGVSTGALYYFFHNKEALFAALVNPALRELDRLFAEPVPDSALLPLLFTHRDALRLLLERAEGPRYEAFVRKLRKHAEQLVWEYTEAVDGTSPDESVTDILADMYCAALKGLAEREGSYEELLRVSEGLRRLT